MNISKKRRLVNFRLGGVIKGKKQKHSNVLCPKKGSEILQNTHPINPKQFFFSIYNQYEVC